MKNDEFSSLEEHGVAPRTDNIIESNISKSLLNFYKQELLTGSDWLNSSQSIQSFNVILSNFGSSPSVDIKKIDTTEFERFGLNFNNDVLPVVGELFCRDVINLWFNHEDVAFWQIKPDNNHASNDGDSCLKDPIFLEFLMVQEVVHESPHIKDGLFGDLLILIDQKSNEQNDDYCILNVADIRGLGCTAQTGFDALQELEDEGLIDIKFVENGCRYKLLIGKNS